MTLQLLISAVDKEPLSLAEAMNLPADGILINQCGRTASEELEFRGHKLSVFHSAGRGVGRSRNAAFSHATADISLFSDEDIRYEDNAKDAVLSEFATHPEADLLLFNVRVCEERRTYWNSDFKRVRWYNSGRYPGYAIAARTKKLRDSGVSFSLLFGGGARYSNGEDSLFLMDCLKAGLKLYRTPVVLGEEEPRPSTWFHGYDRKFFFDRGVLYHYLYGAFAVPLGFRFLMANRETMCKEVGFGQAFAWLKEGVKEGRTVANVAAGRAQAREGTGTAAGHAQAYEGKGTDAGHAQAYEGKGTDAGRAQAREGTGTDTGHAQAREGKGSDAGHSRAYEENGSDGRGRSAGNAESSDLGKVKDTGEGAGC